MFKFPLFEMVRNEAKEIAKRTRRAQIIVTLSNPGRPPRYKIERYRISSAFSYNERMIELIEP